MKTKYIITSLFFFLTLSIVIASCEKAPDSPIPTPIIPILDSIIIPTPNGSIAGRFSVSPYLQVYFSRGNLQYQATTNTWRFAENQYDHIGNANSNISPSYDGWIDLFGWGTGINPTNTAASYSAYSSFTDWGINNISNGTGSFWRTLSRDEWMYVFGNRSTPSGILYVRAQVCGVDGIILFPDDWNRNTYPLYSINNDGASYYSNAIDASNWINIFEENGAVFLPANGYRSGSSVYYNETDDGYWSSSYYDYRAAYGIYFNEERLCAGCWSWRYRGESVRLVCDAQ